MRLSAPARVLAVLMLVSAWAPALAQDEDALVALDAVEFVRKTSELLVAAYTTEKGELEGRLAAAQDAGERRELERQIAALDVKIKRAAGCKQGWEYYSLVKSMIDGLKGAEKAFGGTQAVAAGKPDIDSILAGRLAPLQPLFQTLNTAADHASRVQAVQALVREFEQINRDIPHPRVRGMLKGMQAIGELMKQYESLPVAMPIVKDYVKTLGTVLQAASGSVRRIATHMFSGERGMLTRTPQYHPTMSDGRSEAFFQDSRFRQWHGGNVEIYQIQGCPNAYALPGAGVVIWDPQVKVWEYAPDLWPREVQRRYAWLMSFGVADPTVDQVLARRENYIGVLLLPEARVLAPGDTTEIEVVASSLKPDALLGELEVTLETRQKTLAWFQGRRSYAGAFPDLAAEGVPAERSMRARNGASVTWQAPESADLICQIGASMPYTRDVLLAPPCYIATGKPTRIEAAADANPVAPGHEGLITFQVLGTDGQPLSPVPAAAILVQPDRLEVGEVDTLGVLELKAAFPYRAPDVPGTYRPEIRFEGLVIEGYVFHENFAPCTATVEIVVEGEGGGTGQLNPEWVEAQRREFAEAVARTGWRATRFEYRLLAPIRMTMAEGRTHIDPIRLEHFLQRVGDTQDQGETYTGHDIDEWILDDAWSTGTSIGGHARVIGHVQPDSDHYRLTDTTHGSGNWRAVSEDGGRSYKLWVGLTAGDFEPPPMFIVTVASRQ